ncbi:MAG: hypothetical protein RJA36_1436 [Pseudomonadota bacterium]|jgi:hypothetical protein
MAIVSTTTMANRRSLTTAKRYREVMPATKALDVKIETIIGQCSAAIERYVGRILARERVTEKLREAAGTVLLVMSRRPIQTVHSLKIDGVTLEASKWSVEHPEAGVIRLLAESNFIWDELAEVGAGGDYGYRSGPQRLFQVEIDYTAGWIPPGSTDGEANLPEEIEAACQMAVRAQLERQERPIGVTSERLGDASWSYTPGTMGQGLLPDELKLLLDPFRTVSF